MFDTFHDDTPESEWLRHGKVYINRLCVTSEKLKKNDINLK